MNIIEKMAQDLQSALEQIDLLAGDNEQLEERNQNLIIALEQSYMANTELEESIAELNTIHGDSPVTMDIEHINSLFQQATQGTLDQPQTSVVPIVETINSVIARSLITMDQGKEPRINVQDMLNLQELSHRWVLTDEAKNTL